MTNIEEIMAQISPALRKKLFVGSELPPLEFAETPSVGLNRALGGGYPYGGQTLVWGNKSSGKTANLLGTIAIEQPKGKVCAWVDVEGTFEAKWATRLGIDVSKLIVSKAGSINDMTAAVIELMHAGVDFIGVDSYTAALPAIYFEKDSDDLKELENTKQIGSEARDMKHACAMMTYANAKNGSKTALVLISQQRNQIGQMYTKPIPTGGQSVLFYSQSVVKLFSSESENQAIKGKIHVGDKIIEETIGRKVRWEVQNSKTSAPFQTGSYDFYFRGPEVGIDSIADLVDTAEYLGFIERAGAWYTVEGERYQGREKMVLGVKENLDVQDALREKINGAV